MNSKNVTCGNFEGSQCTVAGWESNDPPTCDSDELQIPLGQSAEQFE